MLVLIKREGEALVKQGETCLEERRYRSVGETSPSRGLSPRLPIHPGLSTRQFGTESLASPCREAFPIGRLVECVLITRIMQSARGRRPL